MGKPPTIPLLVPPTTPSLLKEAEAAPEVPERVAMRIWKLTGKMKNWMIFKA